MGKLIVAAMALLTVPVAFGNHSWGGYHWARTANPFTLKLGNNLSSNWEARLIETSSDWSASSVLDTTVVAGTTTPRKCRPAAGRIEVCNASYGNTGWLGIAQVWVSGLHITQATAKMNDTYFNQAFYNTQAWRELVMCQEVAHGFGLDHQDENQTNPNLGTCMDYTNNPLGPPDNEHPNAHDFAELETIYAHLDSTTTVAATTTAAPPAMNDIDFEGPGQWGRKVKTSKDGKVEAYELDFGNGHKIITHVLWTDGADAEKAKEKAK